MTLRVKKILSRASILVTFAGALALAGCSPFVVLNAVAPGKGFSRQAGIAYGPLARQQLDIYVPDAAVPRPFPVVVFFYGGGWESGKRKDYRFVGAELATHGVMTIVADYRLYPEVVFPKFIEDGALAVKWAQEHAAESGGNPKRLFLMGHSAGAQIAAMLALNKQYLRAAGADPHLIAGLIGLSGPYDFLPLKKATLKKIFGDPAPRSTQPIDFVTADAPPALLVYGSDDTTVDPGNSLRLAAALKSVGRPASLRAYPGVGHSRVVLGFSAPLARAVPVTDDVMRFIESN